MGSISKAGLSSEESGWTTYFDDFFNNHNKACWSMAYSVVNSSSSLVSDATSFINLAAKKVTSYSDDDHQTRREEEFSVNKNVSCRATRSNFRKRKKAQAVNLIIIDDDDVLRDTATSPLIINSFKVN
ncbi:hypothetical protein K1719_038869 [Acacia pycnantha]|nr:hypothetical protein K1719_038869 [Acacia pycnantha]